MKLSVVYDMFGTLSLFSFTVMFGTLPLFSFTVSCMDYALINPGSLLLYADNNHNHEAGSVGPLLCF